MDLIDEQIDAYNARDLDRYIHCYAEDITIEDGAGKVMVQGREAVRALWDSLRQQPGPPCTDRQSHPRR